MEFLDFPVRKTLADIGLDAFAQSPLQFSGGEVNQKSQSYFDSGVPSNFIQDGDTIVRLNVIEGWLQSNGFITGEKGWRIDSDGNVEFENGTFRGNISGASGTFGKLEINVTTGAITLKDSSNNIVIYLGP
jgi:hypothetical protein